MKKSTEPSYEQEILQRLDEAGVEGLPKSKLIGNDPEKLKTKALESLLKRREIVNLGSDSRTRFILARYFQPLELAYTHIETQSRLNGIKLGSKSSLTEKLKSAFKPKADEALKLLVQEGKLIKLSYAGKPVYLHVTALPPSRSVTQPSTEAPSATAISKAYRETVAEFGYPDVLIHEVFLRLGGDLEAFKSALKQACQEGRAVAGIGDWSLSSPEERATALYINGHPHLRIRIQE